NCAVAIVVEELNRAGGEAARTAIHRHALPGAVRILTGLRKLIESGIEVVCDEEIEMAVAIVVEPRTSRAITGGIAMEARLFGHIRKGPVAIVSVEYVLAVVGDEQVLESVVVVVADRDRRSPPGSQQSGLGGDVGEGAIAVVLIQAV